MSEGDRMILEAKGLFKVFGSRPDAAIRLAREGQHPKQIFQDTGNMIAVSNVDLSVRKGEIFIIMGLSGSGKSTLVRCLNRLIEPTAGTVSIEGEDVTNATEQRLRDIRRAKVAMVFQNFALLPHKTILDNVAFGLQIRGESASQRRSKAVQALDQVGLSDWSDHYPHNLSGGMKQRVGLARALANEPDLLLMDEPFSALDPLIRADLQNELLELQKRISKTIVFITHDFQEALKLGDRIAVMRDGEFVQVGTPQEIVFDPADDYVRNFSRDVNHGSVLGAGNIQNMSVPVLPQDSPVEVMRDTVRRNDSEFIVLVDAACKPVGYVTESDLFTHRENGVSDPAKLIQTDFTSASGDAAFTQLYSDCARRKPVAIVQTDGRIMGAVDARDILRQLTAFEGAGGTQRPEGLQ